MEIGCYYSPDPIGAAIWNAIGQATPTARIVGMLENRHDCIAVDVTSEVGKFLLELEAEQLVEPLADAYDCKGAAAMDLQQDENEDLPPFKSPRFEKHSDMRDFLLVDPIHQVDDRGWPHKESS